MALHNASISVVWDWLLKLREPENKNYLSGIRLPTHDDSIKEKMPLLSGKLFLFKSGWRSNIIKFCGWQDFLV